MLYGSIVDVVLIIIGSLVGLLLKRIGDRYKETIMQVIGLTVVLIGLQMALDTNNILIVLLSVMFGAIIGEFLRLENVLEKTSNWAAGKFRNTDDTVSISQAFVTASLLFAVGAMAILGALDSGLRGDHEILMTKSVLDGFLSFVLASTLGVGVIFSAVPVFLFQGTITLLATRIEAIIPAAIFQDMIDEITAVGGLLIIAIGLNLLKLTSIRVTNLLPSLVMVVILLYIGYLF